jgi:hypothetical protein
MLLPAFNQAERQHQRTLYGMLKNVNEQKIIVFSLGHVTKNAYLCIVRSEE